MWCGAVVVEHRYVGSIIGDAITSDAVSSSPSSSVDSSIPVCAGLSTVPAPPCARGRGALRRSSRRSARAAPRSGLAAQASECDRCWFLRRFAMRGILDAVPRIRMEREAEGRLRWLTPEKATRLWTPWLEEQWPGLRNPALGPPPYGLGERRRHTFASWAVQRGAEPSGVKDPLDHHSLLAADRIAQLDRFEQTQLEDALAACLEARSLSEAGRRLFSASRTRRTTANDADRLRKYLARFGLSWQDLGSTRTP